MGRPYLRPFLGSREHHWLAVEGHAARRGIRPWLRGAHLESEEEARKYATLPVLARKTRAMQSLGAVTEHAWTH